MQSSKSRSASKAFWDTVADVSVCTMCGTNITWSDEYSRGVKKFGIKFNIDTLMYVRGHGKSIYKAAHANSMFLFFYFLHQISSRFLTILKIIIIIIIESESLVRVDQKGALKFISINFLSKGLSKNCDAESRDKKERFEFDKMARFNVDV